MKEEEIKYILAQVVLGIDYLHNTVRVSHRDLKPANILIFQDLKIKISDFGLAKNTDESRLTMTKCGTMMFCAPEILGTVKGAKPMPFKTDIYSLAMTACWMMTKGIPDMFDIHSKTIEFPDCYSQELKDFIFFSLERLP